LRARLKTKRGPIHQTARKDQTPDYPTSALATPQDRRLTSTLGRDRHSANPRRILPKHKERPATSGLKVTGHGSVFVATYSIKTDQTIGGQPVEAVSPRLSVFRKEGDRWLIAAHANFAQIG